MKHRSILAFLAAACLASASPSQSEILELTPAQTLQASFQAMQNNRPKIALALVNALLEREANDISALLLHAKIMRQLGQYDKSRTSAKRAWKLSDTKKTKYVSALLMAQTLSSSGKRTLAQLWLRRAIQNAPNEHAKRIAIRDFGYVRSRNPWATQLRFSIAPNSNINNGSANATSVEILAGIFDFPVELTLGGSALALSGMEQSIGFTTRYRFSSSKTKTQDLVFQFDHKTFVLSSDAKAIAPTAKGRDFAFTSLSLAYTHKWKKPSSNRSNTVKIAAGTNWYGGERYGNFARVTFAQSVAVSRTSRFDWAVSAEHSTGQRAPHANVLRANISYTALTESGSTMRYTLRATDSRSDVNSADYTEVAAGLSFSPRVKYLGISSSFGLTLRKRDYPVSLVPSGRHDREISTYMSLRLSDVDYFGFNPTVTLTAAKTLSNIGRFETNRLGIQIGIQSAF